MTTHGSISYSGMRCDIHQGDSLAKYERTALIEAFGFQCVMLRHNTDPVYSCKDIRMLKL